MATMLGEVWIQINLALLEYVEAADSEQRLSKFGNWRGVRLKPKYSWNGRQERQGYTRSSIQDLSGRLC